MPTGRVKWFDNKKGYGFIEFEGDQDAFVHYTNILTEGFRTLKHGMEVEFRVIQGDKGWKAENVSVVGEDSVIGEDSVVGLESVVGKESVV